MADGIAIIPDNLSSNLYSQDDYIIYRFSDEMCYENSLEICCLYINPTESTLVHCQIKCNEQCKGYIYGKICPMCCDKRNFKHQNEKAYYVMNKKVYCIPTICKSCNKQMCFFCHCINEEICMKCWMKESYEMEKVD